MHSLQRSALGNKLSGKSSATENPSSAGQEREGYGVDDTKPVLGSVSDGSTVYCTVTARSK
jgi:hypothetical protein